MKNKWIYLKTWLYLSIIRVG